MCLIHVDAFGRTGTFRAKSGDLRKQKFDKMLQTICQGGGGGDQRRRHRATVTDRKYIAPFGLFVQNAATTKPPGSVELCSMPDGWSVHPPPFEGVGFFPFLIFKTGSCPSTSARTAPR